MEFQPMQYPAANPAAGILAIPANAPVEPPTSFRVIGRASNRENGDICGEYRFLSNHGNYPVYQKRSTGMTIRFFAGRWLMDRGGLRDCNVCVAWADGAGHSHPACPELIWHVYESPHQSHIRDEQVVAIDAPEELTFVGRHQGLDNAVINGKYTLRGVVHGRALYRHNMEEFVIRYFAQEKRWMISDIRDMSSNICTSWAEAGDSLHPGDASLEWHFWEPEKKAFVIDQNSGLVNAPETVTVTGRRENAENARINGTYYLAGVHATRPLYVQPGTNAVIRYSPKQDRWLIDCDGLANPSMMSRLYQWMLTGDSETAYDRCSAWALARGRDHPGYLDLQWHVWEMMGGRFILDNEVMVTSAPMFLEVAGRGVSRENADVNGHYRFCGCNEGLPAYQKLNSQICIYYSKTDRWVIDRHGIRDTMVCVAFCESQRHCDHPAFSEQTWHVFERGSFGVDRTMSITVPCEVPAELDMPVQQDPYELIGLVSALPAPPHAALTNGSRGRKRGYGIETEFTSSQVKLARRESEGEGGWFGLFGA